jgi:hypothetical protein
MATAQTKKRLQLLFIGNSFTARNDLPGLLTELAASAPPPRTIVTDAVLANGASLRQHWNAGVALEKIRQAHWDFVVLQEQSTLPIKNINRFHENVRLFASEIEQAGAKVVLYETWARRHAPETQAALTEATRTIAEEIDALVVPVGTAWKRALAKHPGLPLHDKDDSHPSSLGSYLAACVFYASLLHHSPIGLTVPARLKLAGDTAHYAQELAWETVESLVSAKST